jgi:signal transduction histidine kinase
MGQTEFKIFLGSATFLIAIFITGVFLFVFQYRKRKILHEAEKELLNEKHQRELLATQLEIQTQTMQHIGREIHDNVGQKLTLASLYTQQLAFENKTLQVTDKIESVSAIINQSLTELRQLSKSLTDDGINEKTLCDLIKSECDKINNLQKCKIKFSSFEPCKNLSYQLKSILLRITQEFLQNSIKHSRCNNIFISLIRENNLLTLHLQDDGIGFDVENILSSGIGIANIKKRASLIDASCNLTSRPAAGTTLVIQKQIM